MHEKVASALPFVEFLGAALGASTEVALHDFTDLEHSLVKVVNGHVSGRSQGAPATDLARKIVAGELPVDAHYVTDYVSMTADGRPLQSSSFLIREGDEVVGMICINIDPKPFRDLEDALGVFMEAYRHGGSEEYQAPDLSVVRQAYSSSSAETLSLGSETGVAGMVSAILAGMGKTPSELDQALRIEVIRQLEAGGAFLIKGAAADVAQALHISAPSVYRYLQQVRRAE